MYTYGHIKWIKRQLLLLVLLLLIQLTIDRLINYKKITNKAIQATAMNHNGLCLTWLVRGWSKRSEAKQSEAEHGKRVEERWRACAHITCSFGSKAEATSEATAEANLKHLDAQSKQRMRNFKQTATASSEGMSVFCRLFANSKRGNFNRRWFPLHSRSRRSNLKQ